MFGLRAPFLGMARKVPPHGNDDIGRGLSLVMSDDDDADVSAMFSADNGLGNMSLFWQNKPKAYGTQPMALDYDLWLVLIRPMALGSLAHYPWPMVCLLAYRHTRLLGCGRTGQLVSIGLWHSSRYAHSMRPA